MGTQVSALSVVRTLLLCSLYSDFRQEWEGTDFFFHLLFLGCLQFKIILMAKRHI